MKFSSLLVWSIFVSIFLVYLMAVQMVRGEYVHSYRSNEPNLDQKIVDFNYHNYESVESLLRRFANQYPHLCQMYSIGKSVEGTAI